MATKDEERLRRSSYFPAAALSKGYSLDRRFTGSLEPSPTGSYYNPSRYAGGNFSPTELNRIQGNLATTYTKDLEYNRLANPNYQTTQDTGYSSTAQFGSGRSSPATTQLYAQKYGTPTGNGLSTFQTPSGGSITYKPSGRTLSGGSQPGAGPFSDVLGPSDRQAAYSQGYGAQPGQIQSSSSGPVLSQGGVSNPVENLGTQQRNQFNIPSALQTYFPAVSNLMGFAKAAQSVYNRINPIQPNQPAAPQPNQQPMYSGPPAQIDPRRYFD